MASRLYVRALPRSAQPTPGCGDGVVVTYKVAGAVRKIATLAWNDTVGQSFTDNVAIIKGQEIELVVEKSGNNYCDGVFIDPTISYY